MLIPKLETDILTQPKLWTLSNKDILPGWIVFMEALKYRDIIPAFSLFLIFSSVKGAFPAHWHTMPLYVCYYLFFWLTGKFLIFGIFTNLPVYLNSGNQDIILSAYGFCSFSICALSDFTNTFVTLLLSSHHLTWHQLSKHSCLHQEQNQEISLLIPLFSLPHFILNSWGKKRSLSYPVGRQHPLLLPYHLCGMFSGTSRIHERTTQKQNILVFVVICSFFFLLFFK